MIVIDGVPRRSRRSRRRPAADAPADGAAGSLRAEVAAAAGDLGTLAAVELGFVLEAGHWIDLDTLAERALAGLRDAGSLARGLPTLAAFVATKTVAARPRVEIRPAEAAELERRPVPGPVAVDAATAAAPRPGDRAAKRDWRSVLAAAWGGRRPLDEPVWADVAVATAGSLLARLEPVVDALEPCLGRDPRGRREFFPRDDLIVWLRVRREPGGPGVRLRLGPLAR